jgi:hypothetical protein
VKLRKEEMLDAEPIHPNVGGSDKSKFTFGS